MFGRATIRLGIGPHSSIEFVEKWPHLGHMISLNLSDDIDINYRKQFLIGQINTVLCRFGRLDPIAKNKLFQAYCCRHYGSEVWDLSCSTLSEYCAAWRRGLRRIWDCLLYTSPSPRDS